MPTIQTTLSAAPRRWSTTALTVAGALIAVGIAVLFLALAAGGHHRLATASHPASAVATAARLAGRCAYVRPEHACVWTP